MLATSSHRAFRRNRFSARKFGAATVAAMLAASGATAQAYQLPVRGESLAADERFDTFVHKATGIQDEGKDIGAKRRQADGSWSPLRAGFTDRTVLTNWVVYGKPVYAMASGTVVGCWRNAPQNVPGSLHASYTAKKFDGNGNHLWILQDNGLYALYAHMQTGSVPAALCPHNAALFTGYKGDDVNPRSGPNIATEAKVANGAHVSAGQRIGLVGNSGASPTSPHVHVHMQMTGSPAVMPFAAGLTTPFTETAALTGPWTKLAGGEMPKMGILFWPPNTPGNYRVQVPAAEYQSQADHLADSGLMPQTITCTGNGAAYDAMWVPKSATWVSFVGMSVPEAAVQNATLTNQGFTRIWSYSCGSKTAAIWRK